MNKSTQIIEAKFNPRLKTYIYASGIALCIITMVGILALPFWLIFGKMYIDKYFENLFCELTTRSLHFKKGVLFTTERTIPLDKIQDLTFREGPILRYFGLASLKVETAGQSAANTADMTLLGIMDSANFRMSVMDQRDEVTNLGGRATSSTDSNTKDLDVAQILSEIHQTLKNIEKKV